MITERHIFPVCFHLLVDSCRGDWCHCFSFPGACLTAQSCSDLSEFQAVVLEQDTECELKVRVQSWRLLNLNPSSVLSKQPFFFPSSYVRSGGIDRREGLGWLTDLFLKAELRQAKPPAEVFFFLKSLWVRRPKKRNKKM